MPVLEAAERGPAVIKQLAAHLADQVSFPDLTGWPDEADKIRAAKAAVSALKAYIDKERSAAEVQRARTAIREEAERQRQAKVKSQQDLARLQARLIELHPLAGTQDGGYQFEEWFFDLAMFFDIDCRRPYKVGGRQIDGSLTIDGTTYLVELKFTNSPTGAPDIDTFMAKVTTKADNTMGLFVAMSGYTQVAIAEASGPRTPLLLFDSTHIFSVLQGLWELPELIGRVRQHASQTSEAYLSGSKLSQ
jgi:hypothetical protein